MPKALRSLLTILGISISIFAAVWAFTHLFGGDCIGESGGGQYCEGFGAGRDWLEAHTAAGFALCFAWTALAWTYVRLIREGNPPGWS